MTNRILFLTVALLVSSGRGAVLPSAEKLLPGDTLLFATVPETSKAIASFNTSPQGQLWNDVALRPFRDKLMKRLQTDALVPLEGELGVKFADYQPLLQGQLTLGLIQNNWTGKSNQSLGWILILDSREKTELLKKNLAEVKKKWTDAGRQIRSDKIRDVEFSTLIVPKADIAKIADKIFPTLGVQSGSEGKPNMEIMIGQIDSVLLIGDSKQTLEKIVTKASGGATPSVSEQPGYESTHNAYFREAQILVWANMKLFVDLFTREAKENASTSPADPTFPKPDKIVAALGLAGLRGAAVTYRDTPEGSFLQFFIGAPEAERQGILKSLAPEVKDSEPPPFVADDSVKFSRWRMNLNRTWTSLETTLNSLSPQFGSAVKFVMDSINAAQKEKEPGFDVRRELIGNLGDDLVTVQKKPRAVTLEAVSSPPSLFLVGSPNPERLANALKVTISALAQGSGPIQERTFSGRKVFSVPQPGTGGPGIGGKAQPEKFIHFAAGSGYIGVSSDIATLEEFLRGPQTIQKSLKDSPGLGEAAQRIGGMRMGFFGFENQKDSARVAFDLMKKDAGGLANLFSLPGGGRKGSDKTSSQLKDWIDLALLPNFDSVAKYFHFVVYSGGINPHGFIFKIHAPTPPGLKR